jgi:hypothetical protein
MAFDFVGAWLYKQGVSVVFWLLHAIRRKVFPDALTHYY